MNNLHHHNDLLFLRHYNLARPSLPFCLFELKKQQKRCELVFLEILSVIIVLKSSPFFITKTIKKVFTSEVENNREFEHLVHHKFTSV